MVWLIYGKHAEECRFVWCLCFWCFGLAWLGALILLLSVFCVCPERSEGRNFFGLLISVVYPELKKQCKNSKKMCISVIGHGMNGLSEWFELFTCFMVIGGREATKNFLWVFQLSE